VGSAADKLAQALPPRTPTWLAEPVIGPATSGRTRWLASSPLQGEELCIPEPRSFLDRL